MDRHWRILQILSGAILLVLAALPARAQPGDDLAALYQQAVQLFQSGKFAEAVPVSEQYAKLTQERMGSDHGDYARALHGLATVYKLTGRTSEAEEVSKQSLAIRERLGGPNHPLVADSLLLLADIKRERSQRSEAEALVRRALAVREASLGREHLLVADALAALNIACDRPECALENESHLKRIILIRETGLGPSDRLSLISRFALAAFYWSRGRLLEAEPLYIHGIAEWEKLFGSAAPELGMYLYSLGEIKRAQRHLEDAKGLHVRALAINERKQPFDKTSVVAGISALALIAYAQQHFTEAVQAYQRILSIKANDVDKSWAELGLAKTYHVLGEYANAEPLYKRALESIEREAGPDNPEVADLLNDLANLYEANGRYFEVEPLHKRALAIRQAKLGPDDKSVALTLHNLARLYQYLGRYQEAQQFELRAIAIKERATGSSHPDVAESLLVLAYIYGQLGRYDDAEPLIHRAKAIYKSAAGDHRASLADTLLALSALRQVQKNNVEAEALLREALDLETRAHGSDHPNLVSTYNALANFLDEQGRVTEATAYLETALHIAEKKLGSGHPETLWSRVSLALRAAENNIKLDVEPLIAEAKRLAEGRLGSTHPALISPSIRIGRTYMVRHNWISAYEYMKLASEIAQQQEKYIKERTTLSGDKRPWNEFESPYASAVKAAYRIEGARQAADVKDAVFKLSQLAIQTDASSALGQMAARFASGSGPLATLVRERQDLTNQRRAAESRLFLERGVPAETAGARADAEASSAFSAIEAQLRLIDDRLRQEFPQFAALANPEPMTISETQAQLRPNEVLVQFMEAPKVANLPSEMFVWVITRDQSRWASVARGSASLNELVRALRCGLDRTQWAAPMPEGLSSCERLLGLSSPPAENEPLPFDLDKSHTLYQALLGSFEDLIGGKHLLIVPSGSLTSLPFQVLITGQSEATSGRKEIYRDAKWLIARQAITILPSVSSLKVLRQSARTSQASRPYLGFGNPLLDGDHVTRSHIERASASRARQRCPDSRDFPMRAAFSPHERSAVGLLVRGGLANPEKIKSQLPLPETADEICAVARNVGSPPDDLRLGAQATETEIKALSADGRLATYRILHFATHGAVSGDIDGNAEPGLILTPPATATVIDDGYLTTSEVANLKLDADWVILSACNTASGGTANPEALSGLARSFFYAGARSLLVSHWSVESEPTVDLITNTFAALQANPVIGRAEALRRSMVMLIAVGGDRAHPATWAPFVVVGEGGADVAIMTGATTVTNVKKLPTNTPTNRKRVPPPPEDWRAELFGR